MAFEKLLHGKPFRAPVQGPKKILDIGCGTGVMTVQLGKLFPDAQVIGLDISPVPDIHERPSNVEYIQGDFLDLAAGDDTRLAPGTFDYVFSRMLHFGIRDWPRYVSSVFNVLAPGGWAELQENGPGLPRKPNGDVHHEFSKDELHRMLIDDLTTVGLDMTVPSKLPGWLKDSGFVDVRDIRFKYPMAKPLPTQPEAEFLYEYHKKYIIPLMCEVAEKVSKGLHGVEVVEAATRALMERQTKDPVEPGCYVELIVAVGQKPLE